MTKDNVLWAPSLATCMHSYMDTVCKSHGSEDIKSQKYLGGFHCKHKHCLHLSREEHENSSEMHRLEKSFGPV